MAVNIHSYKEICGELATGNITLIAVSKTKSEKEILELYQHGQRDFGENYVQELTDKSEQLPKDIRWHFIGHLQSNKVKFIAPFVSLIHSVDSEKLLKEINKQAAKNKRIIDCLLQVHIAEEETKFGFDEKKLHEFFDSDLTKYQNIRIRGFMGMGSFSDDENKVRQEFKGLKGWFDKYFLPNATHPKIDSQSPNIAHRTSGILSMGMSSDYKIAVEEGSNMVRIGSLLFGKRIKA
ncbi:MAG: YggS family pyridoxal phosphate-dependent enzyme [Ginsengibacter sp.]